MDLELNVRSKADQLAQTYRMPLDGRVILGRGPESPVALDGPSISRQHLAFEWVNDEMFVTDLSSNGCWVNGQRIPAGDPFLVNEWEDIEVPGYAINFLIRTPQPAPARETRAAAQVPAQMANGPAPAAAAPVPAPAVAAAPAAAPEMVYAPAETAKAARTNPVTAFLKSFTGLERFAIYVALVALALVCFYWFDYS
jgi:predicted component of type VI protein secretion system